MNKNMIYEIRQISFKRSHFILLMCIGLMAIFAFTVINNQFASAGYTGKTLINDTPEFPMEPGNYTQNVLCDYPLCHDQFPQPWIEVTLIENESSYQIYSVNGQTDSWPWIEGWAVLDEFENNLERGFGPGEFTIKKDLNDEKTYRVYWVDADTELFGRGGANYTNIIVPVSTNTPPSPPNITGPISGYVGQSLSYQFVSKDNEGDKIFYYIDWDDGFIEDWFGPFQSEVPQIKSHIWSEPGIYYIQAKAKDMEGLESDWGTFMVNITIQPFEPKLKIRLKMIGIGNIGITFQNKGKGDLSDIQYNVTVKGGILRLIKRININNESTINNLAAGVKRDVKIFDNSLKFKFCIAKVTITAIADGETFKHNQLVAVIGRFVFARPILPFQQ